MTDLFDLAASQRDQSWRPLAERMRPKTFDDFVGQKKLVGKTASLRRMIEADDLASMIFWGPPGTGKTSLARLIATITASKFVEISAVLSGVPEIREVLKTAESDLKWHTVRTILFIDEIHRLNKSQQDALLPAVERGLIVLIGATTENPSFEVNRALLSRSKVFVFERVEAEELEVVLVHAVEIEKASRKIGITVDDGLLHRVAQMADGDVRQALTVLEMLIKSAAATPKGDKHLSVAELEDLLQKGFLAYDKNGEEYYNLISALHKSLRGNDADAGVYWLARMLEAGADPLYIARRLVRFASEDVGLADSQALILAVAAYQSCHFIGMPECAVNLSHLVGYLAKAPKSIDAYRAYNNAAKEVRENPNDGVPFAIRNAPTSLMKDLGYGKGYIYTPDNPQAKQDFLPDRIKTKRFW
ncbi:MAG: replication-associated recombination protein A [Candidatus Magasanikbacteria bacterium]|nr:replication-associated recombination protein A [Candidatus Magasanikbacteria bacterium]MCA9389516.1 replication-associated recombination protein A [Candidatus Magasanikbacteria bacterium]MCA9390929.1 replication-associated recombination protein A [Candidatus Magasanikbacteria bacterium]USN52882.1 MAG: replication-associated recombination protein A [Candidatus Nomurabacteria bacterium]HPF95583.1 replication-associated recombination protein A [bacterium]